MEGRTSEVNLPPTNYSLTIVSPVSYGIKVAEEFGYINDSSTFGVAEGVTFYRPGYSMIIVTVNENASPGLIAHEALHVLHRLYEAIGQQTDPANDELDAYILEYIVDSINNHLCKKDSYKE